jgi:iron complex transport system substrate-binding protein
MLVGCGNPQQPAPPPGNANDTPRFVSLSPSITETIYAIGAGERLVGATDYCNYPEAAKSLPRIGGYFNPNYERIVSLQPDAILLLPEHLNGNTDLDKLDLPLTAIGNQRVADVLAGILKAGEICDREAAAQELRTQLLNRLAQVRERNAGERQPRTLLCIGRGSGRGVISEVYAAGTGSIHDEWLTLAGGSNAVTATDYPMISTEAIVRLNPEIIIELSPKDLSDADKTKRAAEWQTLDKVAAVQSNRIHIVDGDFMMIPGPRFLQAVEALAAAIGEPDSE